MNKDTFVRYIMALGFNVKIDAPAYKSTTHNGNKILYVRDISTYYFDESTCIEIERKAGISYSILSPLDNYRATFFYDATTSVMSRDLDSINNIDDVVKLVDGLVGLYHNNLNSKCSSYEEYKRTTLVALKRDIKISEMINE